MPMAGAPSGIRRAFLEQERGGGREQGARDSASNEAGGDVTMNAILLARKEANAKNFGGSAPYGMEQDEPKQKAGTSRLVNQVLSRKSLNASDGGGGPKPLSAVLKDQKTKPKSLLDHIQAFQ